MPWQPRTHVLNIAGKLGVNESTGTNLIGCSTGNELVTEVSLVLGSLLVLDMVMVSVAPHLLQECVVRRAVPLHAESLIASGSHLSTALVRARSTTIRSP